MIIPLTDVFDFIRVGACMAVLAVAAYQDHQSRWVSRLLWYSASGLAVFLIGLETILVFGLGFESHPPAPYSVEWGVITLILLTGLNLLQRIGTGIGAADYYAAMTLLLLFPSSPLPTIAEYVPIGYLMGISIEHISSYAFAVSTVLNGIILALCYPIYVVGRNVLHGDIHSGMWKQIVAHPREIATSHGIVVVRSSGETHTADCDTIRGYIAWSRDENTEQYIHEPFTVAELSEIDPDESTVEAYFEEQFSTSEDTPTSLSHIIGELQSEKTVRLQIGIPLLVPLLFGFVFSLLGVHLIFVPALL